jgi:hypothetical protein
MEFDFKRPWYHGSPLVLSILRIGSTVTQKRELARIFSYKPTIVSVSDDGQIKHNGTTSGYLYIVTDKIQPKDVIPHPQTTMSDGDEWLTTCELHLELVCTTNLAPEEQLTDNDYAMLKDKFFEKK